MVVLTIVDILLTVQKPSWDLVLSWVLHDLNNSFQFFLGQFTGSLVQVNIGLLTDQVGVTTTDTTNGGQSVNDLDVTIDVGVQQTVKDMLVMVALVADHPEIQEVEGKCVGISNSINSKFNSITSAFLSCKLQQMYQTVGFLRFHVLLPNHLSRITAQRLTDSRLRPVIFTAIPKGLDTRCSNDVVIKQSLNTLA